MSSSQSPSPLVESRLASAEAATATSGVDNSKAPARSPQRRSLGRWLGLACLAVLAVGLAPTLWGAFASMGAPQWAEAVAIGLVFAPAATGVYITFRILDFPDLTVDGSFPAGGAVAGALISGGGNPWLAILPAVAVGAALGAVTALLHVHLRINSLLASIITLTGAFTINLRLQGSANISLLGSDRVFTPWLDPIKDVLEGWWGETGVQLHRSVTTILVMSAVVAVVLAGLRWLFLTEVGLAMRATGSNREMSRSQAINTSSYLIGGVALSNALVALTGAMFVQHAGFADINSGAGLIIAALASVIIGEVLFGGPNPSPLRSFVAVSLGMITYRIAIAVSLNADLRFPGTDGFRLEASDIRLATAALVAALLAVPVVRQRRAESRKRRVAA